MLFFLFPDPGLLLEYGSFTSLGTKEEISFACFLIMVFFINAPMSLVFSIAAFNVFKKSYFHLAATNNIISSGASFFSNFKTDLMSSFVAFTTCSIASAFRSILPSSYFGQLAKEIKGLFPIFSHNSSVMCGQNG